MSDSVLFTAFPFTLALRYRSMSVALIEAEMCKGKKGGRKGKSKDKQTTTEQKE